METPKLEAVTEAGRLTERIMEQVAPHLKIQLAGSPNYYSQCREHVLRILAAHFKGRQ